jgi:hypothetical protein
VQPQLPRQLDCDVPEVEMFEFAFALPLEKAKRKRSPKRRYVIDSDVGGGHYPVV